MARRRLTFWENSTENNDIWIYVGANGHLHGTEDAIAIRQGDDNNVVNYGEITAQQAGVYFQGGEATFVNHGLLTSFGNGGQGAVIFNATSDGTNIREVTNTGIIYGAPQSTGTSFYSTIQNFSGAEFHLNNSGSILADGARAVYSSATENFFENSGVIDGEVVMTGVTEMFNSGTITGDVTLSSAADQYIGSGDGVVSGVLNLNSGDDYAILGNGGGVVEGGSGDDTIRGGTGSDEIDGGNNDDDIRGRQGDDIMDGGSGNDIVRAGLGDDVLDGGSGNDFMRGGAGEDIIIGGLGQDTMFGNGGADVFVFNTAAESTNAGAAWDRIMDFNQGEDLIDLSNFNARFIGTGAYAANGNIAEVRIFEDPNGDTRVFVDVNADGVSDMRFYLVNTLGVTADDFIL